MQIINKRGFNGVTQINDNDRYEYIFTSNVLEHIEDDQSALKFLFDHLVNNGKLGIFVPANRYLFSHIDKKLNHYRRYSKRDLMQKVSEEGFHIDTCVYVDSLGLFAWLILKLFRVQISDSDSRILLIYDRFVWPISKFLDKLGLKKLFGKNLLLLATKI